MYSSPRCDRKKAVWKTFRPAPCLLALPACPYVHAYLVDLIRNVANLLCVSCLLRGWLPHCFQALFVLASVPPAGIVGNMYRCGQKRQREAKSRLLFTIQQYLVVSNGGLASPFGTIQSEGLFVRLLVWEIICTSLWYSAVVLHCPRYYLQGYL